MLLPPTELPGALQGDRDSNLRPRVMSPGRATEPPSRVSVSMDLGTHLMLTRLTVFKTVLQPDLSVISKIVFIRESTKISVKDKN